MFDPNEVVSFINDLNDNEIDQKEIARVLPILDDLVNRAGTPNLASQYGFTLLMMLSSYYVDATALIARLLELGADINFPYKGSSKGAKGETAFTISFGAGIGEPGHVKNSIFLAEHGADINSFTKNGDSLLHLTAIYGLPDHAKYLIGRGVDVNLANRDGTTPLETAVAEGELAVVVVLLCNGANISNRVKKSMKDSDYENEEIRQLIKNPDLAKDFVVPKYWQKQYKES